MPASPPSGQGGDDAKVWYEVERESDLVGAISRSLNYKQGELRTIAINTIPIAKSGIPHSQTSGPGHSPAKPVEVAFKYE